MGLVSGTIKAGTATNEPPAEIITVTAGEQSTGSGTDTAPFIIKRAASAPEARLEIKNVAGTTVHCTVTEVVGTAAPARYDGNPVTFPLGLDSKNEKTYKVEYYTDGIGYKSNAVKTKYYKVLKQHTVTFNANGGTYSGGATTRTALVPHTMTATAPAATDNPTRQGYTFGSWYKEAACTTQWNFTTDTVTGDITLYAKWTAGTGTPYEVDHYQQKIANDDYAYYGEETLHGTTGATINADTIKKNYEGFECDHMDPASPTIAANGSTVVKLYYKRKTYKVNFSVNGSGGNISATAVTGGTVTGSSVTVKYGGSVTFTAVPDPGYAVDSWSSNVGDISTDKTTATLSNVTETTDKTVTVKFKKVYTVRFKVVYNRGGILKGSYGGHTKIANDGNDGSEQMFTNVSDGDTVSFEAVPDPGWKVEGWTFDGSSVSAYETYGTPGITKNTIVTVEFKKVTAVAHGNNNAWKLLKKVVEIADENAVITINGRIEATGGENAGQSVIDKNLTIKRADGAASAVLDANKMSRIFKVESGKTLTLENLTLKGGIAKTSDMDGSGGGVYVETSGKLIMTGSSITDCEAIGDTGAQKYGEGGGVYNKGTFEMTGGEIRNNKARNGGGIDNNGTLILTNATLTGNTATFIGSALCMSSDSSGEMTGGKIISNTCSGTGDGGVYIHAGTFTLKSGASIESNTADYGGGAYVSQNGTLIINGGSIKLNKAQSRGGGVYVSGNSTKRGTLRMIQGDISDNGAGWNGTSYTGTGGGVYNNGVFEMTGGEIKDNKAETGGGVYFPEGTFKMSGSAVVTPATGSEANDKGNNDVYLKTGQAITVDGSLSHAHAARITPESYTEQVVLKAGSGVTLANEVGKFAVTPDVKEEGIAQAWKIDSAGKLEKTNMEVHYDKLGRYLSQYTAGGTAINRVKIIDGSISKGAFESWGSPLSDLAQKIQNGQKRVALTLPDSIKDLTSMKYSFYGCDYLVSLENIPSSVTEIQHCFQDCKNLTQAPAIPSGVGDMTRCFSGCEKLTQAPAIPSGVTSVESCFSGCTALTQGPDIPSSVSMMYHCFDGCTSLKRVKLMCNYDDSVSYFVDVFKGCTALVNGGIKVPSGSLTDYQSHAGKMGTTAGKFSGS